MTNHYDPVTGDPDSVAARSRGWQGAFVSDSRASASGDPAVYFRREFTVNEIPLHARLSITALGIVVPYLNGTRVGDEVLAPGWTSYRHRLAVSTHDVTSLITDGVNALGAVVGEGWAVGALTWDNVRYNYSDRSALFAQLELEYSDRTEVLSTDERFRIATGAVGANGVYSGETYDARLDPDGWAMAGFDDTNWAQAQPFDWPMSSLTETGAPPIRRIEELAPTQMHRTAAGTTIVDFGQNISGWVRITVAGEAGTTVTIQHAEILTPTGELERESNRTAEATDRYTLRGDGVEVWEPQFTFHGFRYVEIEGWPGELTADAIRAVVVHSDMTRTGWFETSDKLVNRLHENTLWSMRDNFVGLPSDCPQRDERMGWTGDLNAFSGAATFLYDVRDVLTSWLQDLAVEQQESGQVPWTVPDVQSTPSPPTALWSDVAVSLPWELFQEYGDAAILLDSYDSMTSYVRQVEAILDENSLWTSGFQFGDWLDPDAPADNAAGGKTDRFLVASAFLVKTTREMAQAAEALGHEQDQEHFLALHERVRDAFRAEYVTATGRVVGETATSYSLAIMFGILEEPQRQKAGERLAEIVKKNKYRISTGFAGTPLVAEALSSTGHLDAAYRLLMEKECPSFLYPVTMGATTIWERWDSVRPDGTLNSTGMTSLNHYALGAVSTWLHRVVGGLVRTAPGWARLRIAPQPGGGLTSARVVHDTVRGRAEVWWLIEDGVLTLTVAVPAGASATVALPLHADGVVEEVSSGTYTWSYPVAAGYEERPAFSMDTPVAQLADDAEMWASIRQVLSKHLPGFPFEASGIETSDAALSVVVKMLPVDVLALEEELNAVLDR